MVSTTKGFAALTDPKFRIYFSGAVAATHATWIFRILILWTAWDLTHSASFVGLITTVMVLPVALASPIFGTLVDRNNPVRVYFIVSIAYLLCPLGFLALSAWGLLIPATLLILAGFYSFVVALYQPLRQSLGPRLVAPDKIGSVMSLAALNHNAGRLIAPAFAGLCVANFGTDITAMVAITLYIPSVVLALTLSPRRDAPTQTAAHFFTDFRQGISAAWAHWPVRQGLLLGVFTFGPMTSMSEMLALVADGQFDMGAQGLGWMTSAVGVGALAAALGQVMIDQRHLKNTMLRMTVILFGLGAIGVMVLAPYFQLALAAAAVLGFTGTAAAVSLQVSIQAELKDNMRGRVMSLWMMAATASTAVCALGISTLADYIGLSTVVTCVIAIAATAIVWISTQRDAPAVAQL